MTASTVG